MLTLCLGLLMAGCGNRGSLYLPPSDKPAQAPAEETLDPADESDMSSVASPAESGTVTDEEDDRDDSNEDDAPGT